MSGPQQQEKLSAEVEEAKEWLEREKRLNSPPAIRFLAMQAVGKALKAERESSMRLDKKG